MIYRFVIEGGPWMLPILGASVVGLALVLERLYYWVNGALVRDARLRERLLRGETPPPGATVRDPVARVLVEAVHRPDDLGIASARAERILRESKAYLALLRFVGGAASLGGLLATTLAVRDAFRIGGDAAALNARVANALHPTILGLVVFLALYAATAVFHALSAGLARELDDNLDDVARILRRAPIVGSIAQRASEARQTPAPRSSSVSVETSVSPPGRPEHAPAAASAGSA